MDMLSRIFFEIANRFLGIASKFLMSNDAKKEKIKQLIDDGVTKIKVQLYDEAIKCFEEAIRLDPRSLGAHLAMIQGLREKGKDLEALSWGKWALTLADSAPKRAKVYLLLGSTALDTFKRSHALEHAKQSLDFYQLALEEDPMDLRPMWNSVETHMEIFLADWADEVTQVKHRKDAERGLRYLDKSLMRRNDASLAARFVREGETIEKRLSERAMSVPEFNEGLGRLRIYAKAREDLHNLERIVDRSDDDGKGFRRKILAYVMAAVGSCVLGVLLSAMSVAEGAQTYQIETWQVEYTCSQSTEMTPRVDQVFVLKGDDAFEVSIVDLDWDEIKRLGTVDPDWEEMKKFV